MGTGVGGVIAPWFLGTLIATGSRVHVFYGYLISAVLMFAAAMVEAVYGVKAEMQSLEKIARPLSAED